MAFLDWFRQWPRSRQLVVLVYLLLVIPYTVYTLYNTTRKVGLGSPEPESARLQTEKILALQEQLKNLNEELRKSKDANEETLKRMRELVEKGQNTSAPTSVALSTQVTHQNQRIDGLSEQFQNLQRALNPLKPAEVLTVSRLGDRVEAILADVTQIKTQMAGLETQTDARLTKNYDDMTKQVDRIVDLAKWLGLLIVPFVIGFAKDFLTRSGTSSATASDVPSEQHEQHHPSNKPRIQR